jgi:hypothetical protein
MSVMIPRRSKLIHDSDASGVQVLRLPALTPRNPLLVVCKSFGLANEMQHRLPAMQVGAKVTPNHIQIVSLLRAPDNPLDLLVEESSVIQRDIHVLNRRHFNRVRLTFGISRGGLMIARAAIGCVPVLDGVPKGRNHFVEIRRQFAASLDHWPQRDRR